MTRTQRSLVQGEGDPGDGEGQGSWGLGSRGQEPRVATKPRFQNEGRVWGPGI